MLRKSTCRWYWRSSQNQEQAMHSTPEPNYAKGGKTLSAMKQNANKHRSVSNLDKRI